MMGATWSLVEAVEEKGSGIMDNDAGAINIPEMSSVITSAPVSSDTAGPQRWFLTVSLGPVQDFIAAARATRDLWFGSWLLSELSREAARTIVREQNEAALIFPTLEVVNNNDLSVVNKVAAIVTGNEQQVRDLGAKIGCNVQKFLCQEW